jgi:hypothetical protein
MRKENSFVGRKTVLYGTRLLDLHDQENTRTYRCQKILNKSIINKGPKKACIQELIKSEFVGHAVCGI